GQAAPAAAAQPSAPPAQQAAQQPAPQVSKAPEVPKPATQPAAKPGPQPKPVAPPEPSLVDELLENPMALFGIGAIVVLLLGYGAWSWRRKKSGQARFQDSVAGGALAGAAASSVFNAPEQPGGMPSQVSVSQSNLAAMEADEVDPIAEADVYMAYGRDTQAEEILKEAVQKDPNRAAVHAKLLEIYAGRRDGAAFEQTALKLKGLTNGVGPEWEKAAGLGRSLDPTNSLYGGGGSADVAPTAVTPAPLAPPAAPTLDFDLDSTQGGGSAGTADIDFDIGSGAHEILPKGADSAFSTGGTLKMKMGKEEPTTGLDFDLGGGEPKPSGGGLDFELPASGGHERAGAHTPDDTTASMNFDLHLDTEGSKAGSEVSKTQPSIDLSSISLDLGGANDDTLVLAGTHTDPKWQEVATKLDLAKAYEDMGDKDGARELLNEVMQEGDAAQKGQAQQMLASLG
ncbi:MAG: FimV/HubP family polar landmark protein, partial [Burkholderiales bacterium]